MNLRITLTATILIFTTNSHAGWLDKLSDSSEKVQQKIESTTEAIKNSGATTSVKSALSNEDIVAGLKEALNKGAGYAVNTLGKADGFLKNNNVKIPMPEKLAKVESLLRKTGNDKYADEFIITMNRAAESAISLTLDIIKQGVTRMSIADAKNILQGPDDAATQYLKKTGGTKLNAEISPIVKNATSKAGVTSMYTKMYDKLGFAGKYLNLKDYNVDDYVTQKTVGGLFTMIAQEEKKIRDNPAARTTDILKAVFGKD
ncbi:MAG: DUF4197 domain-containing protein [Gammaproteobacteria bacterium]|nr:DUF4197 domain-containing protein [Gammaproteobacteria bacterium]